MDVNKFKVAALIEQNIAGEARAREEYYTLMNVLNEEDIPVIEEIISDELNHSEKLKALAEKYSNIYTAND